jgi:aminoglycoside phosphotransferase (APT) family kinase protein
MTLDSHRRAKSETQPPVAEEIIKDWIETNLGGQVTRIDRQGRWRPAWYVDLTKGAAVRKLYVRGERAESFLPYSVHREFHIQRLLEQAGVRTPHVHGFIDALPGIVMDLVPGRPNLGSATSSADREAVRNQLIDQMALMHSLDVEPFCVAGLRAPKTPRAITLSHFDDIWGNYQGKRRRVDPAIEFAAGWVLRNAPPSREPLRYTACDAGQFLFDGPKLTSMMDFELSVLGDPLMDLAALRIRDQWEPLGDLPSFFAEYGRRTGREIDLQTIRFHTASFGICGTMSSALCTDQFLSHPLPDADYVEYTIWVIWELKQALAAIGEFMGIKLPEFTPPEARSTLMDEPLFALESSIAAQEESTATLSYRKRARRSIVTYLGRINAYGGQFESDYCGAVAKLLGERISESQEADARLAAWVHEAGPEQDERLLRLLYENVCRRAFLLAAPDSPYLAGLVNPLIPI